MPSKSQAMILLMVLLILVLMSLLAISASDGSLMEARVSRYEYQHFLAFNAAEIGLKVGHSGHQGLLTYEYHLHRIARTACATYDEIRVTGFNPNRHVSETLEKIIALPVKPATLCAGVRYGDRSWREVSSLS